MDGLTGASLHSYFVKSVSLLDALLPCLHVCVQTKVTNLILTCFTRMFIGNIMFCNFPKLISDWPANRKPHHKPHMYNTLFLLSLRARSCRLKELLSGRLRTHLFLSSPENNCNPMSAMTARKNRNKTRTSLNNFKERSSVFTIARRPATKSNSGDSIKARIQTGIFFCWT